MAKIELKGFIDAIGKEETFGEKNTRVQKIVFKVPPYTDEYGDTKGKPEYWEISVMGDKIDTLDLNNKITDSRKAKLKCFVNSKVWYKLEDTGQVHPQYSAYVVLHEIEHII